MDPIMVLQTVMSAIQSGAVNLTAADAARSENTTATSATNDGVAVASFSLLQLPTLLTMLLSYSAVRDWLKLLLLGALVETGRRLLTKVYHDIINYFWLTATFDGNDECVDWLMFWLSKHSIFRTARTLDVSTRSFGKNTAMAGEQSSEDDTDGRKISFLPSLSTTYTLWYRYRYVSITRDEVVDGPWNGRRQTLQVQILTRDHQILRDLLLEAKNLFHRASENMISIYVSDPSDYWKRVSTHHKRPMQSIILDPGTIELVLEDAKDFFASKAWYAERGIPHRRGYLLYGAPGSGKTSLIHSIAGELNLDVYILSLTRLGLDDTSLSSIIADLPTQCIVLVEDIDAAFHQGVKRDIADPERDQGERAQQSVGKGSESSGTVGRVTLSGLLNALDGIAAQEGRILFATTNDYDALDPALCRPGRLDLHIEFKLASKYQCREMFRRFYLPSNPEADSSKAEEDPEVDEKDSGYGSRDARTDGSLDNSAQSCGSSADSTHESSTVYVGMAHTVRAPKLSPRKAAELADSFASAIPNRAFSMATLQGYLMAYKTRPYDAVADAPAWVERKLQEKKAKAPARGAGAVKPEEPVADAAASAAPAASPEAVTATAEPKEEGDEAVA
ncbi:P-loop containing nucleoside triphosphate hydrolase protein [Trametes coccinea BRFM310]|uniref:p-loop containing nucleoside triphosphate hydrolase protein n=1 Tax=Trametes coccinea (strain BRFM310) TaxID=1353009 RepID=A0A1Y2IXZ8_TRAC3|nr:P-loop containing nucleoside triphosphate hydrolase protein [Trametes coccinea BRFM310]